MTGSPLSHLRRRLSRRRALAMLAAASAAPGSLAQAQGAAAGASTGFAGLGAEAEGFAAVTPDRPLAFPADHAAHPGYRIEWWYLTGNLEDDAGRSYGLQWTLFRQALRPEAGGAGWDNGQIWLAHAAVSDATRHLAAERAARGGVGQAGAQAEPFEAWLDAWRLGATSDAPAAAQHPALGLGALTVSARSDRFSYDLTLTTDRPPVLQGEQGFSVKSERGQASYYYSQPFFRALGALRFGDKEVAVQGRAWMDREWSSQPLAPDQEGWDWFSLHLASGEKAMLFRLRHGDGSAFFSGNWITPTGESTPIPRGDIRLEPLETVSVAGRRVPIRWRLQAPSRGLDLEAAAINPESWMALSLPYWEGPVRLDGGAAGVGYLEMTGY